jgi:NADH-quinone oxidoreductase subunit N
VALGHNFYENHQSKISDFIAIKYFFIGRCCCGFFGNLAMFFLGSKYYLLLYILAASDRMNLKVMKQE